jgi:HEAT repeat protein
MIRIPIRAALAAFAAFLPTTVDLAPGSSPPSAQGPSDTIEGLVGKLKAETDKADPKLIQELAGQRSRTAMEALLDVYNAMNTTFMRREIVRALVQFDGVPDAEQPALQKLMDVATQATEPELRRAALDGLGECRTHGKDFLMMIVRSPAADSVREYAMELHVTLADKTDQAWYRELYQRKVDERSERDKAKKEKKEGKKKEAEAPAPKLGRPLNSIRARAFEAGAKDLAPDEVVEATGDPYFMIRKAALIELERRGDKRALELAQTAFEKITPLDSASMILKVNERVEVRVVAAQIYARLSGTKVAPDLIKRATNPDTPMELRLALAESLAGFNDPTINRQLLGELGKGRSHEKLFRLWAVRKLQDEKVDRAIEKLLSDKDDNIVIAACHALADRNDGGAAALLQKLVKGKNRDVIRAALDAMSVLRRGDPTWLDELLVFAKSEDPELRNLALQALGQAADRSHLPKLIEALNDKNWSTRLAALEALERLRIKEAISAIIVRMGQEDGRMLAEFANTMWRLTGQPYQDKAKDWDTWWKQNGESFQILSEEQLEKVKTEEKEWRLKQVTRVDPLFFGIRVISHRAIFIVDVSGSMNEELHSDYEGKTGHTRMDVVRRELQKCIQGLDPAAFFNLISFSSDVGRWVDGSLAAANAKNRDEAKAYLAKLAPLGGTNLYAALKAGFADEDVDTIFVMSDGEPSVGEETDQLVIRDRVKQWNEHRGIVINTIAVGGQFQILEWLAADSGGTHVRFE